MTDERGVSGSGGGVRRVYHSDPAAPTAAHLIEEFERLASQVYVGLRGGVVDCEAVFDLACSLLEWGQPDPAAEALAVLAAEGTDRERIAELARQVLAASSFEPGFDAEPTRLAVLEEALGAVRSDMQATGLPGPVRIVVPSGSWPSHAQVEFRGGGYGSTAGIAPEIGSNPLWALVAVAEETQDSVMETIKGVWPVCPTHQLGAHSREHEGQAVWWCNGDRGHVVAAIGQWNDLPAHTALMTDGPGRFLGYDVTPVRDLAAKVEAVYESIQPPGDDPMTDTDERDLVCHAADAGFIEVDLELHVSVKSRNEPVLWDRFVRTSGNPLVPSFGEAVDRALSPEEATEFTGYLRPFVESGAGLDRMALAYVSAVKE